MSAKRKCILCVEDEVADCELLSYFLAEYEVIFVPTAAEALAKVQAQPFDLYILDVRLPDFSGVELARRIHEFDQRTPLIFHSACAFPDQIEAALQAGAQMFITKPSDPYKLVAMIKKLLDTY